VQLVGITVRWNLKATLLFGKVTHHPTLWNSRLVRLSVAGSGYIWCAGIQESASADPCLFSSLFCSFWPHIMDTHQFWYCTQSNAEKTSPFDVCELTAFVYVWIHSKCSYFTLQMRYPHLSHGMAGFMCVCILIHIKCCYCTQSNAEKHVCVWRVRISVKLSLWSSFNLKEHK